MKNYYYWHWHFNWWRLKWVQRRLIGSVAPNGDLADGHWEYR